MKTITVTEYRGVRWTLNCAHIVGWSKSSYGDGIKSYIAISSGLVNHGSSLYVLETVEEIVAMLDNATHNSITYEDEEL